MSQPISVAQLNRYVSRLLEQDAHLNPVMVRGEISGFRAYPSGHLYFSLKDEQASVSCVMFRGQAQRLRYRPANGDQVIATAKAGLYDRDGRFQLYVSDMVSDGQGDLHLAFEQLKKKLEQEGLFAADRKKPIPRLPHLIGVATSSSGAVIRDIIQVLGRRFENFRLQLIPVPVQGPDAAPAIAAAIERFNERGEADILIVGRGGGSIEDLWAFNEEIVARAVAASQIPVISAVGHETDFTICDFVADMRAPTPSAAAELAMPVKSEALRAIDDQTRRLARALKQQLTWQRQHLRHMTENRVFRQPLERFERERMDLDQLYRRLHQSSRLHLNRHQQQLAILAHQLDALSPLKVLSRGYGLVQSAHDGRTIKSTALINSGDLIDVWLSDGVLDCQVRQVRDRRIIHDAE